MRRSAGRTLISSILALLGVLAFGPSAAGHALQPGYLELRLMDADLYAVVWRVPAVAGRPMAISAELPERCDPRSPGHSSFDGLAHVFRWTARCPGGIEGGVLHVAGLSETATDVLVRFDLVNGETLTQRLTSRAPSFVVPATPSSLDVVRSYTLLGIEHILGGIDHLAFVLALLLIVKGTRKTIATITAFTLAHSISLVGATLGYVAVPGPPVEATIALSIVFVAAEIIHGRRGHPGLTERYPWLVAFIFGLLHGFGFAGALAEVGLPSSSIPMALLFFNVGVEIGQLLFIACMLVLFALAAQIAKRVAGLRTGRPLRALAEATPPYVIGSFAVFWLIQRIAEF